MELNLSLVLQEPIQFNNITIYQPTLQDIIDYGFDKFNNLLMPFMITKNTLQLGDKKYDNISLFDVFTYDGSPLQPKFLDALSYFCRTDKIIINSEKGEIKIGNGILNKNNFDAFSNIILKCCSRSKLSDEEINKKYVCHKQGNEQKVKQIIEKLHKSRENNKNNQLYLWDIIKVVEVGGNNYIPISEIKKMTMWKIVDLYASILNIQTYKDNFEVFLVSGDKNIISKHWIEQIKIK